LIAHKNSVLTIEEVSTCEGKTPQFTQSQQWRFCAQPPIAWAMLDKNGTPPTPRNPLIYNDSALRTWHLTSPQAQEKEREIGEKKPENRAKTTKRAKPKSASKKRKTPPNLVFSGVQGFAKRGSSQNLMVEPAGIEPASASHCQAVLHA
jgi:hypothetical protein